MEAMLQVDLIRVEVRPPPAATPAPPPAPRTIACISFSRAMPLIPRCFMTDFPISLLKQRRTSLLSLFSVFLNTYPSASEWLNASEAKNPTTTYISVQFYPSSFHSSPRFEQPLLYASRFHSNPSLAPFRQPTQPPCFPLLRGDAPPPPPGAAAVVRGIPPQRGPRAWLRCPGPS